MLDTHILMLNPACLISAFKTSDAGVQSLKINIGQTIYYSSPFSTIKLARLYQGFDR